ncbi:MAG TPA: hypothetical protein DCP69_10255 [Candidatus Omnitrophica bacterium]|nr:hypothetical protein [Candidatus Omnitrophota bacterium]
MAGITLEQAEAKLAQYMAAEEAVLTGQSYRLNTGATERELKRADLASIQQGIRLWEGRIARLSRASRGMRVGEVIPR